MVTFIRYIGIGFALLYCICVHATYAQERDTIPIVLPDTLVQHVGQDTAGRDSVLLNESRAERRARRREEKEREKYYFKGIRKDSARLEIEHISRVAWRRSLFVPGWGQYTNGRLWWIKVPVIYGGFVAGYLTFDYWQFYYREFSSELQYRFNNNGEPSEGPLGNRAFNEQYLTRQRDFSRRNRDITILVTLGWYGLNVVEAYVDSMLSNRWNISDDLSFKLSPTVLPMFSYQTPLMVTPRIGSLFTPGLKLTVNMW